MCPKLCHGQIHTARVWLDFSAVRVGLNYVVTAESKIETTNPRSPSIVHHNIQPTLTNCISQPLLHPDVHNIHRHKDLCRQSTLVHTPSAKSTIQVKTKVHTKANLKPKLQSCNQLASSNQQLLTDMKNMREEKFIKNKSILATFGGNLISVNPRGQAEFTTTMYDRQVPQ